MKTRLFLAVLCLGPSLIAEDNPSAYQLHLQRAVRFNPIQPGSNAVNGQALFGLAADGMSEDKTNALFQGFSQAAGRNIVANGRTCFTCHRGASVRFGLPPAPLSVSVPITDALFTGMDADAQGDPDAMHNLDQLALIKYRPGRFNLARPESDPFRQVFFWRKSIPLFNVAFAHGFLNDGRARVMFETDRGAVFSHTQNSDDRFDDLFSIQNGNDMEAFQFSLLTDPRLAALRNPADPLYNTLVNNPFFTVDIRTDAQRRGKEIFRENCMGCHSTPNVFNNLDNVEPAGNGDRPVNFPSFAPSVGRMFNVGVSERNKNNLRFTLPSGGGIFTSVVLPLAKEDGTMVNFTVAFDIGLAATTGRFDDVGRFKVPQLRGVSRNAPYFHDNSAATLQEVIGYFNSPLYNNSKDGRESPIHMSASDQADLIEFLKIL